MALRSPILDNRSFPDLLAQLRESAKINIPEWQPGNIADPGVMLQHTFSRLTEIIIESLNRAPEKQMLAFLDAMGISPLPPVPAATALLFSLKKDAPPTLAPKGTAVTAAPADDGPSLVFTTTEDLMVLPMAITCAYSFEPGSGRFGDYTGCLEGKGFTPFSGSHLISDAYYFIDDIALSIDDPGKMYLILNFAGAPKGLQIRKFLDSLDWFYSDEEALSRFVPKYSLNNSTAYDSLKLEISPPVSPRPANNLGGGREPAAGRYLKCTIKNNFEAKAQAGEIKLSYAEIEVWGQEKPPQNLFCQNCRPDPDEYFLPFGSRPKEGDSFYIGIDSFSNRPGATIFLNMQVSSGMVGLDRRWCDLKWSYSTTDGWQSIKVNEEESYYASNFLSLAFICPNNAAPHKVGGMDGCWLRVVLPAGDYGCEAKYILKDNVYVLQEGTGEFYYPKVKMVRLKTKYEEMIDKQRVTCQSYRQTGHIYTPLGEDPPTLITNPELSGNYFYLGFDRFIPHQPVSLYVDAEPLGAEISSSGNSSADWEFLANSGWQPLYAQDNTAGLAYSGLMRFSTPEDAICAPLFDNTARFWIRLAQGRGGRLKGIYLNAVPAEQATNVTREALGFGNGRFDQRFNLRGFPVLSGQRIWVQEAEAPTAAELSENIMEIRQNPVTLEKEYWLLWQEQNSFGASEANSRHYILDRNSGEICFGDGSRGMAPEKGAAIAAQYRFGGGERGNLPAGSISKPILTLKGIDKISNPIPASGGARQEGIAEIMERGPMALRHRGRGVTARDLEWLVKEAAGADLDRIKCLPADDGQAFTLMLIPAVEGLRPLPDGNLSARVRNYLGQKTPVAIADNFAIIGPRYIKVGIAVTLIPVNPFESIPVRERASLRLHTFLHPRRGGTDGQGWQFGRNVYLSEICAILEEVEGVDRALAGTVSLYPAALQRQFSLQKSDAKLEISYPSGSLISLCDSSGQVTDQWLLAEAIESHVLPDTIPVTGLRDGDLLNITQTFVYSPANTIKFLIDFPAGSLVRLDGADKTILNQNLSQNESFKKEILDKEITEGTEITIIHPDTLLITDLWDKKEGGYTVTASSQREEVPLVRGLILECSQSNVKAKLNEAVWESNLVTLHFRDPSPGPLKLTHPDGLTGKITVSITSIDTITDTVYLCESELCTPGNVEIQLGARN